MIVENGVYICRGSPWGKNMHIFENLFPVKKLWALSKKKYAKFWQRFIETLAKTAIHLPGERMQLKVVIEENTNLFFDWRQTVLEFGEGIRHA